MNRGRSKHSFVVVRDAATLERKRVQTPRGYVYGYFYNSGHDMVLRLPNGRLEDIGEINLEVGVY